MIEPTDAEVEAFQKAWHEADAQGLAGERTRAGLRAVLALRGPDVSISPVGYRNIRSKFEILVNGQVVDTAGSTAAAKHQQSVIHKALVSDARRRGERK